ncbi:MAG: 2-oxoacid:acceptor oxidoreductase family protein [Anaerolineae bacterium]|nr:2-oxoacid:acceptor oxidoreductase family protein [Anaerolineae bacterium]
MGDEFVFAGFGGQGVMFAGQLLAYAAMDEGLEVTWIPSYGPEMRGGTAHCLVVVSQRPIGSPVVQHPKVAVVFNNPSFDKYAPLVAQDGLLIVNASLITRQSHRSDLTKFDVPATQIADQLGDTRVANMVLLGTALAAHPVLPLDAVCRALEAHLPKRHHDLLPLNLAAIERGAAYAANVPYQV